MGKTEPNGEEMKKIRMLDSLMYGDTAVQQNDIIEVGKGSVDPATAEAWVRAGLALPADVALEDLPGPTPAASKVVVHERGGQELLQAASTIEPSGKRHGPADENPTDTEPEVDAEAGASRTAAGTVIAENADPAISTETTKKGKKK